jgi:ubiquinone/menaquinone biosynthesis C-methylase UbiE
LFSFLADCCEKHERAWDCATGNGQAARALTPFFDKIIATDASEAQIEATGSRTDDTNVEYRIARAEACGMDAGSIDLITVAQALHWFDIARFFDEAQRVLAPGGVLAVWCYERCLVEPGCNDIINVFADDIVGPYWPPERKMVDEGYRNMELPMPSISSPAFAMTATWSVEEMLGYLRTWSSSQRYLKEHDSDPLARIEKGLRAAWGDGRHDVTWPLTVKIGRA